LHPPFISFYLLLVKAQEKDVDRLKEGGGRAGVRVVEGGGDVEGKFEGDLRELEVGEGVADTVVLEEVQRSSLDF
jgi:hypothetical protein